MISGLIRHGGETPAPEDSDTVHPGFVRGAAVVRNLPQTKKTKAMMVLRVRGLEYTRAEWDTVHIFHVK